MDRRDAGDIEDRNAVRRAAGSADPGTTTGRRPVPANPAPDRLNGIAAGVGVHRDNQEESFGVTARTAVAVRRTLPARSSVATGHDINGIRGQLAAA